MNLYDGTIHRLYPDLPRVGIIYEFAHDGRCLYPRGDRSILPTPGQIRFAAGPLSADPLDQPVAICVDDESRVRNNLWSNTDHLKQEDIDRNISWMRAVMLNAREAMPRTRIGGYRFGTPGYAHKPDYKEAEVEAFALAESPIIDGTADILFPVLYPRESETTFELWRDRANKTEAATRHWGKPRMYLISLRFAPKHQAAVPYASQMLDWIREREGDGVAGVFWDKRLPKQMTEFDEIPQ